MMLSNFEEKVLGTLRALADQMEQASHELDAQGNEADAASISLKEQAGEMWEASLRAASVAGKVRRVIEVEYGHLETAPADYIDLDVVDDEDEDEDFDCGDCCAGECWDEDEGWVDLGYIDADDLSLGGDDPAPTSGDAWATVEADLNRRVAAQLSARLNDEQARRIAHAWFSAVSSQAHPFID